MPDIPRLKAEFFRALSHPLRIRLLEVLAEGSRSVSALVAELGVEQPLVSQQLSVLRGAGFVTGRREGASVIYELADERTAELLATARAMLLDQFGALHRELRRS